MMNKQTNKEEEPLHKDPDNKNNESDGDDDEEVLEEVSAGGDNSNVEDGTNESNENAGGGEEQTEEIPIELQLDEVDMDDPDMDPLEWSVRKVVPIPKAYFWETGNNDVSARTKMWHRSVAALGTTVRGFEKAGECVANVFGLNSSKYDYVTSTMTEKQWEDAKKTAKERKEKRKEYLEKKEKETQEEAVAADVGVAQDVL